MQDGRAKDFSNRQFPNYPAQAGFLFCISCTKGNV
jgi:hypothetical protein